MLIVLCFLAGNNLLAVELIAHRGYTCRAVENSSAAVADAWLARADGVELDLRVSSDGVILVYHDEQLGGRRISDLSYDKIRGVAVYAVPTFQSILDLGQPQGFFLLDLKDSNASGYRPLGRMIAESGLDTDRVQVQSQSVEVLTAVRETMPDAAFFYLAHLDRTFPLFRTPGPGKVLKRIDGAELDGVSLKGRRAIDEQYIGRLKDAGYRVNVWTINDPVRAVYYRDIGADGLITDAPESLRSVLESGEGDGEACFEATEVAD